MLQKKSFTDRLIKKIFQRKSVYIFSIISLFGIFSAQEQIAQPLAEGKEKFIGCGTSSYLSRYLDDYFNQVTPGNDGKWGSVSKSPGNYDWTNLDKIYNFTINRNFKYKHHTLVWGSQQPGYISSLDTASQRAAVEEWIKLVGERYPNMSMVDVVNEPFHAPPVYKEALGGDGETGWDWVIKSFELARKYCASGVELVLNEYNVLHDNTVTSNYLNLINLLKDRGLLDAIGIQCHYFELRGDIGSSNNYVYNIGTIKSNLDRLAATGLPIYITEFDIDEPNDQDQLDQYKIYFPIFWNHPGVKGITFWGYIQGDVWTSHPNTYILLSNGDERPAMQWLRSYVLLPFVPRLISPSGTSGEQRNPIFKWYSSLEADSYRVQISTNRNLATLNIDTVVVDTSLQLNPLFANTKYYWRVSALNEYGESDFSNIHGFSTGDEIVSAFDDYKIPNDFILFQNYPNPFNPNTTIKFQIPQRNNVEIKIYDLLGREVLSLVNETFNAGIHSVDLDVSNLTSGIYFYKMITNPIILTKKMLVVK